MKPLKDYSFVRGFNYTQSSTVSDMDFWEKYDHDVVDRDMGYAERLKLNSARIFLTYTSYLKDKESFLRNLKDFMDTAWAHGITTNPIIYHGMRFLEEDFHRKPWTEGMEFPLPKTLEHPECWKLGEVYFDDICAAVGKHPGLLFWDISNEPGYRMPDHSTWYPEEPAYLREGAEEPDMEELRRKQELVWRFIRHFCRYVKQKDPDNAIGVGNTYIYETEASGTAELVDIIVFHDYFETRKRVREMYDMAMQLSEKYHKPVINNETCCLCRANPYDMVLELISGYPIGWYAFELMIGVDMWNRVHGIVYPDGTVRDPAIVSALFGFFRNRGPSAVDVDVNQEDFVQKAEALAKKAIAHCRSGYLGNHSGESEELLEACEFAANLLEGGQHVPMDRPPTAMIAAWRREEKPDTEAIKTYLVYLIETLKRVTHVL